VGEGGGDEDLGGVGDHFCDEGDGGEEAEGFVLGLLDGLQFWWKG